MALIKIKQVENLTTDLSTLTSVDVSLESKISTDIAAAVFDIDGDISSIDTRVSGVEDNLSTESSTRLSADNSIVTAFEAADSSIDTRVSGVEDNLSTESSARLSADNSIVTAFEAADSSIDTRISGLEAVIVEDNEFFVETFAGNASEITVNANNEIEIKLEENVQNDLRGLVWVFINGIYAPVNEVSDDKVTLSELNYSLDANDIVKVQYQFEV